MTATLAARASGVSDLLLGVREALFADELVPYLGPGLLELGASELPSAPTAVAAALNKRAPAPARIRANMWAVAQFIESRRHRKTLQAFMADIFAAPATPSPLQGALAELDLSLIVDAWYDDAMISALRERGKRDFAEVQGVTRAGVAGDLWTRAYDHRGDEIASAVAAEARTLVYAPHGGVRPAKNFLVSDSDYVETLTEIDIQSPIPHPVKQRRATRGFLFLGCRFDDQMLRTYARQIMKRSRGPHCAVVEETAMTRNELRFFCEQDIVALPTSLQSFEAMLAG